MKQTFTSVAQIAQALRDTDLVDYAVHEMSGGDKNLRMKLTQIVDKHFITDASALPDDRINSFAQELYDIACAVVEPA